MNLRKLPPSMLLALGLACGDDEGTTTVVSGPSSETATVSSCLDIDPHPTTTDPGEGTVTGSTGGAESSTGDGMGSEVSTGPCLRPPDPTDTEGTSSDSAGTSTGDTGGSTGMTLDEPSTRAAAVERVLERGALPPDVAARLRRSLEE